MLAISSKGILLLLLSTLDVIFLVRPGILVFTEVISSEKFVGIYGATVPKRTSPPLLFFSSTVSALVSVLSISEANEEFMKS